MAPGLRYALEDIPEFGADEPVGIAIPCGKYVYKQSIFYVKKLTFHLG